MSEVRFELRLWGIPLRITRELPASIGELTPRQFVALTRYIGGGIRESRLISILYGIPFPAAWLVARRAYWSYKLIEAIGPLSDLSRPVDRFLVTRLPGTPFRCDCRRFKGISLMRFMFADTMYARYLRERDSRSLHAFIAAFFLKEGEDFQELDVEKRGDEIARAGIDETIMEAVLLNYMLLKKWLSIAYPYMFASDGDRGDTPRSARQGWIDIFDAFVGERIPDTNYYKDMPCMDAFRIINRRMKEYAQGHR